MTLENSDKEVATRSDTGKLAREPLVRDRDAIELVAEPLGDALPLLAQELR